VVKRWTITGLAALLLIVVGCQSQTKQYSLLGQVMAKDQAAGQLTVKHDDIPGFMPAMTMPYRVKDPAAMQDVQPGDKIVADLISVSGAKDYWLQSVRIVDQSGRQTAKPAVKHALKVGEPVPDIPMINQDGKQIHLGDFKGKGVLITFIYTRCPMPAFCPRLSSQFARIHEDLAKTPGDYDKTHLLTISFDPKYDTAPVLRKYGLAYLDNHAEGFAHWDFASADPTDMRRIADAFGLEYFEEDNQISHSMDIVLLTPEGTVAKYWSTEWTAAELETALRHQANSSNKARGAKG
jgi:protein SCO1/2